jgi:hypothetical protein
MTPTMTQRDLLILLDSGFTDPKRPGEAFICPDGAAIEGLLASDAARNARLDIRRVPFERPRRAAVDALSEAHQSLPVLVLGEKRFVTDTRRTLALLAERHGFPKVHD